MRSCSTTSGVRTGVSQDTDGGPASYSLSQLARGRGQTEDDALRRQHLLSTWCVASSKDVHSKTHLHVTLLSFTRAHPFLYKVGRGTFARSNLGSRRELNMFRILVYSSKVLTRELSRRQLRRRGTDMIQEAALCQRLITSRLHWLENVRRVVQRPRPLVRASAACRRSRTYCTFQ